MLNRTIGPTRILPILLLTAASCLLGAERAGADTTPPTRGAQMPYLSYEAEAGDCGGGAVVVGPSMDASRTEAEASGRKYVELAKTGAYVEWQVKQPARGLVLRFTIPDSADGTGLDATLGLYLNGARIASLPLTSRYSWQYFQGNMHPSNDPKQGVPLKRFDDIRYAFPKELNKGDVVRLQRDDTDTAPSYGIDLIELEPIPDVIPPPPGALDVSQPPYNVPPNDTGDNSEAFKRCLADASAAGKPVYIPPGRFRLGKSLELAGVRVQGAGIWHTELNFINRLTSGKGGRAMAGGLLGNGGTITVSDLFLTSETTGRDETAYHGIKGYFGAGSIIANVWSEHFSTGAWIADYSEKKRFTDGLVLSHCRFRNTFADGVNFASGSRNCVVEQSHFRNNGDDAMATWPSGPEQYPETRGNVFRFNTVENTYRAAGLGIFGGQGHLAHDCIIRDVVGGAGIRFNTVFIGHPFSANGMISVHDMTLERTGTTDLWKIPHGAITFETLRHPLQNIQCRNIDIIDSGNFGICYSAKRDHPITNVHLDTVSISGHGKCGIMVKDGTTGWSQCSGVKIANSGGEAVSNHSTFELRNLQFENRATPEKVLEP